MPITLILRDVRIRVHSGKAWIPTTNLKCVRSDMFCTPSSVTVSNQKDLLVFSKTSALFSLIPSVFDTTHHEAMVLVLFRTPFNLSSSVTLVNHTLPHMHNFLLIWHYQFLQCLVLMLSCSATLFWHHEPLLDPSVRNNPHPLTCEVHVPEHPQLTSG